MDVKISAATQAYGQAAAQARQVGTGAPAAAAETAGSGFSSMVKDVVGGAVETTKEAEAMTLQAVVAPTNISQVALAVTNAEITLQTVVAVRDRVIQAYQDILKMPI